ncbi:pilus assembly protein PilP [Neptuniibacter caesariensis]|uniref:Pilus assembly protein, PilQ n=1 Tax=Neptuniibacter caesariensis TaxID=207954 RepID=A0A7U8GSN2_NEPCE|nr:pilus assembly protein PilP [Neptuniibacter caesariensis]EAR61417.1 Pilus assembly protein, PilQ [Oceanospirillum sp. MED92] [Neptuniibacter caesariensis]
MDMSLPKRFVVLITIASSLTGCIDWVEGTADLKQFVVTQNSKPAGPIEPLPEFKPYHSFVYEGASMREPFTALLPIENLKDGDESEPQEEQTQLQPDKKREKEYLETFALDSLVMVGTIELKNGSLWALIKDSNSELHRVSKGNFMGLDYGEITSIDDRSIQLSEIISNGRGGWMKRPRSIDLLEQE